MRHRTLWWEAKSLDINGIFKGGGARGLLYAGALRAVAETGHWFRAVAGAITASLIAAGLTPDEMKAAVPQALSSIKRNFLADLVGRPLVGTEGLRSWLEAQFASHLEALSGSRIEAGPVTFEELFSATGIELHVVCVDVARRQPMVFNFESTPTLSVADAVVASSSIPIFFRPGRLEVGYANGQTAVHRLMDGGVWANYPAFVFKDASFRAAHQLPALPDDSTTIGFVLEGKKATPDPSPTRLLRQWTATGGDRGAFLKGWLRFAPLRVYLLTIVPLVVAIQAWYTIDRYGLLFFQDTVPESNLPSVLQMAAGYFDGFFSHFWPGFISVVLLLIAVAGLLMVLGATLIDSAIPAMRTLMAVGTDVPYWVGTTAGDHVVRISVPDNLSTFSFSIDPQQADTMVNNASSEAKPQLAAILGEGG